MHLTTMRLVGGEEVSGQPLSRRSDEDQGRGGALLCDAEGRPIGNVLQAKQDRLIGRGAGTVLLIRRHPSHLGG
jgi:hypothetical protein